jgi:hypothetical protein
MRRGRSVRLDAPALRRAMSWRAMTQRGATGKGSFIRHGRDSTMEADV